MTETIVVAVLSLIGTLAGAYLSNRRSTALLDYRLQVLEAKVDRHNHVIERTYRLEQDVRLLEAEGRRIREKLGVQ